MGKARSGGSREYRSKVSVHRYSSNTESANGSVATYESFPIAQTKSRSYSPELGENKQDKAMAVKPRRDGFLVEDPGNPLGNVVDFFSDTIQMIIDDFLCGANSIGEGEDDTTKEGKASSATDNNSTTEQQPPSNQDSAKTSSQRWKNQIKIVPTKRIRKSTKHKKRSNSSENKKPSSTTSNGEDVWNGIQVSDSDDDSIFKNLDKEETTTPKRRYSMMGDNEGQASFETPYDENSSCSPFCDFSSIVDDETGVVVIPDVDESKGVSTEKKNASAQNNSEDIKTKEPTKTTQPSDDNKETKVEYEMVLNESRKRSRLRGRITSWKTLGTFMTRSRSSMSEVSQSKLSTTNQDDETTEKIEDKSMSELASETNAQALKKRKLQSALVGLRNRKQRATQGPNKKAGSSVSRRRKSSWKKLIVVPSAFGKSGKTSTLATSDATSINAMANVQKEKTSQDGSVQSRDASSDSNTLVYSESDEEERNKIATTQKENKQAVRNSSYSPDAEGWSWGVFSMDPKVGKNNDDDDDQKGSGRKDLLDVALFGDESTCYTQFEDQDSQGETTNSSYVDEDSYCTNNYDHDGWIMNEDQLNSEDDSTWRSYASSLPSSKNDKENKSNDETTQSVPRYSMSLSPDFDVHPVTPRRQRSLPLLKQTTALSKSIRRSFTSNRRRKVAIEISYSDVSSPESCPGDDKSTSSTNNEEIDTSTIETVLLTRGMTASKAFRGTPPTISKESSSHHSGNFSKAKLFWKQKAAKMSQSSAAKSQSKEIITVVTKPSTVGSVSTDKVQRSKESYQERIVAAEQRELLSCSRDDDESSEAFTYGSDRRSIHDVIRE